MTMLLLVAVAAEGQPLPQRQLQQSMITGTISPTAQQIIDAVKAEYAKTIEVSPELQTDELGFDFDASRVLCISALRVCDNGSAKWRLVNNTILLSQIHYICHQPQRVLQAAKGY